MNDYISKTAHKTKFLIRMLLFRIKGGSRAYWEERYARGGNSGSGSYGKLTEFKAEVINEFVEEMKIRTVLEWGCGDGNQLRLAKYEEYLGIDVSKTVVERCRSLFKNDSSKRFIDYSGEKGFANRLEKKYDLALSLDVIYHLVEKDVFETYMDNLFSSANRYVCIYSSDNEDVGDSHVRNRKFTDYVNTNYKSWKLIRKIDNIYSDNVNNPGSVSGANFYFYEYLGDKS